MSRQSIGRFLILLGLVAGPVVAETGVVRGRVTGPAGGPLPGVRVTVAGSGAETTTNVSGIYRLQSVAAGSATLIFDYLGFEPMEVEVEVTSGSDLRQDVRLGMDTFGAEITVSGTPLLQGQAKALNQQRTALNIKNIVSADQIGQFPDMNAAEAAQRIPSVTLQRDQGEGRYVIVRGVEPRLNSMLINGERVPSPEGSVREVALDVIPADLLEAIEVSKTLTPEMDGDAIGGSVNLITQRAPVEGRYSVTAGVGQNDISDDGQARFNATAGQRFNNGRQGLLISGHWHDTDRGSENFEVEYDDGFLDDLQLRNYTVNRERIGFNFDFDSEISDRAQLSIRGILNEFSDQEFRRRHRQRPGDDALEREVKDRLETQDINSLSISGDLTGTGLAIDYRVTWSDAEEDEPNRLDSNFVQENVLFNPNVTPTSIDPDNIQANPLNEDLAQYEFDEFILEDNITTEQDLVASLNVSLPRTWSDDRGGLFKFGGKVRFKEKDRDNNTFELEPDVVFTDLIDGFSNPGFLDGRYTLGPFHSAAAARDLIRGLTGERDLEEDLGDFDLTEDSFAVYGQAELFLSDSLSFLGGLRFESTDADYEAFELIFDVEGDPVSLSPTTGSKSTSIVLPNAQFIWRVAPESNVRFALTRSLARPNFSEMMPSGSRYFS